MRLVEKNIRFVKEHTINNTPYNFFVLLKDGTDYIFANYDEHNRTTTEEFKEEWLPISVQRFMAKHPCVMRGEPTEWCGDVFTHYIYR